ncbi:hypothetical protein Acr_00g0031700 [Actinidia rufa]|uniref:Uncharacterized protein n=1 Tax=Actinidia rufa TaxID=165716 RepID=A0A7J0DFE4_9ERIC|nr:hypothetical protein Acr_00g0031700 [Actinidia rufa]
MDGDEQRRRLQSSLSLPDSSPTIPDQMAFAAPSEVEPMHVDSPDFNQLQTYIAQLQSHLGLAPSSSSGSMAAIVVRTLTALHGLGL